MHAVRKVHAHAVHTVHTMYMVHMAYMVHKHSHSTHACSRRRKQTSGSPARIASRTSSITST